MTSDGGAARPATAHDDGGDAAGGGDAVELRIPAEASYLRVARFAAADAAARAELGLDEIDDVRLAVSELCGLLTGTADPIDLRFEASPGVIVVRGRGAPGALCAGENGELAQTLVQAVMDEYRFAVVDRRAEFTIVKHRAGG